MIQVQSDLDTTLINVRKYFLLRYQILGGK